MEKRVPGLVSIVVPCWNRRQYIRTCLEHLAQQTYRPIEIIIVDDGSSDGTMDVVNRWRNSVPADLRSRVIIARVQRNMGYPGAVTTALFMTRGEFIAFQDSDDYSHPNRLRKQVNFLRAHANVGIVGSSYRVVHRNRVEWKTAPNWLKYGVANIRKSYSAGSHCITIGSVMMRGRIFDRLGGMTRRVRGAEDWALIANYLSHGVKADNINEVLYFIRRHPQQMSNAYYKK